MPDIARLAKFGEPLVAAEEQNLVDDLSRGDLLRYALTLEPGVRVVPDRFGFPTDAAARPEWFSEPTYSQLQESPNSLHLWQFSERGRLDDGLTTNVDVNLFRGSANNFDLVFGRSR